MKRRWLSDEEFLEGLTISQVLPGPNMSNLSVYVGQRLRGRQAWLVVVATFLADAFLNVSLPLVLLIIAPINIWLNRSGPAAPQQAGRGGKGRSG